MFKIVKDAAVWWPVKLNVPADGGTVEQVEFEMKFRRVGVAEAMRIRELADAEFIAAAAVGWRGVADDEGASLAFTATNIAKVLDVPGVAFAIGTAFAGFMQAIPETRLGNSALSPAGGPAAATQQDSMPTP